MDRVRDLGRRRTTGRVSTSENATCDERCREDAVRQRQFVRRMSTPGSVRLV